jgi:surfactin synthase thioesterase subunit
MSTLAVRHAWLQMSSRKRKLDDDELTPRKRIQSLENTMADMSLIQARSTTASLAWSKPQSREGMLRIVARDSDVMEGLESTNEPETDAPVHAPHQDQDVRMTRQTWYEPEKDSTYNYDFSTDVGA